MEQIEHQLFYKEHQIDAETLKRVIEDAKDYALTEGIAMWHTKLQKDSRVHLPFCILPTPFPKKWFEYVYDLQPHINHILHKVSYSKEILEHCLSSTIEADEFIRNIFNIFENVYDSQSEQTNLGLLRTDYLLNNSPAGRVVLGIKQVENNTIAAGFCAISQKLRDLYEFTLRKMGRKGFENKLPQNKCCDEMAKAMISAWRYYKNPSAIILFVVEESTFNICDQRALEFKILEISQTVEVRRCTFKSLRTSLTVTDKKLYVYGKEVAVVYYRVGYSPEHYQKEDWNTRLSIELSHAIKCPSVGMHLAGTKKVQQYLTQKGVLETLVSPEVAEKLRKVFANQYLLNMDEGGDGIVSRAIKNPDAYVLKPEREGGGNNLYDFELKCFLENLKSEEATGNLPYVLMDRIKPPGYLNCLVQGNEESQFSRVSSELGIFGAIIGNKDKVLLNNTTGILLRSKPESYNEGGVAAGFGALGYPYFA